MKKVLIVRHAKSSWETSAPSDFERPLNERGNRDAPEMAKRLLKKEIDIDAFVSSPANRALTTATYFAEAYGVKHKNIIRIPALYEASVQIFFDVLSEMDNDHKTIALFSHNPGVTYFANQLTSTRIDNMPTCGIYAVKCDVKKWKDFAEAEKEFWFFDYPKNKED